MLLIQKLKNQTTSYLLINENDYSGNAVKVVFFQGCDETRISYNSRCNIFIFKKLKRVFKSKSLQ